MHDTTQIQQAKQKADRLLLLSFTPMGLIGMPRLMAGKDMHSWKFAGLLYIVGIALVTNSAQLDTTLFLIPTLLNAIGVFVFFWAVSLHAFMMVKDTVMFWRISEDKQRFLVSQQGIQQLIPTNR